MKKVIKLLVLLVFMSVIVITPLSSALAKTQASISIELNNVIEPTRLHNTL